MYRKIFHIKRFVLLLGIVCFPIETIFSQHSSTNNYTGAWETPTSWTPTWTTPQTSISGYNITINGYITVNGSLSFSGSAGDLIINDTLVIKGDLSLDDKNSLTINVDGILVVWGNLNINKHAMIIANGYFLITGNIVKGGPNGDGTFTSNQDPVRVTVGGTIPSGLTDDNHKFPALNCTAHPTAPYPNSTCSYGNMVDLMNDPIYPFFQSTCTIATPTIAAGGPTTFCAGGSVTLTSSLEAIYLWSNGATPQSITVTSAGSYSVRVKNANGCLSASSVATIVAVNELPGVPTIAANGPTSFCEGDSVTLNSSPGNSYLWSSGLTSQSITVTTAGSYSVKVANESGCLNDASVPVVTVVNQLPVLYLGNNGPVCEGSSLTLTGSPSGMKVYLWSGPGDFSSFLQNPHVTDSATFDMAGTYRLIVTNNNGCINSAKQNIVIYTGPIAFAGPDQVLKFTFETQMSAALSSSETGVWSLILGSGIIDIIHSPTARITELSAGENKFLWKVLNENCEDTASIKITVFNLFVPSVITPNGDGKNDDFRISDLSGKAELIIFNRWGNEEYRSGNYLNDWNGRNNKGTELPEDTYFYILKFDNGKIIKGSVLIKR